MPHRTSTSSYISLSLAVLFTQLQVTPVAAEPSPSERETARSFMAEGDRLRAQGDLRGALARYEAANSIMHVPTTGVDLARVQAQLGLLVEARGTALQVVHLPVAPGEPDVFTRAREQALALAEELEKRVPALVTQVQPRGAAYSLSIDGVAVPTPVHGLPYRLNPGAHSVRVEAAGYAPETRQVALGDGETQTLPLTLVQDPEAATNGQAAGYESQHHVSAELLQSPRDAAPSDPASAGRVRAIVGLSVGGAALLAGSIGGILSLSQTSGLKRDCMDNKCDASSQSTLTSANTLANVANVCLPIGIVGIAYGLYELLTLPSAPTQERSGTVRLDFTGAGATLRGTL